MKSARVQKRKRQLMNVMKTKMREKTVKRYVARRALLEKID